MRLLTGSNEFLERGAGAALHVLLAGGDILRRAPEIFDNWDRTALGCCGAVTPVLWLSSEAVHILFNCSTLNQIVKRRSNSQRVLALTKKLPRSTEKRRLLFSLERSRTLAVLN